MRRGQIPTSRRATAIAACLSLAFTCSSSAIAQKMGEETQTGSRDKQRFKPLDAESSGQIDKTFARCVYRRNRGVVDELLAKSDYRGQDLAVEMFGLQRTDASERSGRKSAVDRYDLQKCIGEAGGAGRMTRIQLQSPHMRAMMAEEAYLAANKTLPAFPADAAEALPRYLPEREAAIATVKAMAALADCITLNDTQKSDMLLRTMPGSDGERSAAVALAPVVGDCLVQGQTFKMTPLTIRALVADGMWARYARTVN